MASNVTRARSAARFGAVCLMAAPVVILGIGTTWLIVAHLILRLFDGNGAIQRGLERHDLDGLGGILVRMGLVSLLVMGLGVGVVGAAFRRNR